jgi:hypothetical protein
VRLEESRRLGSWDRADLRAGKLQDVIAGLKRLLSETPELRDSLQSLIRYHSENVARMNYDEYLPLEDASPP